MWFVSFRKGNRVLFSVLMVVPAFAHVGWYDQFFRTNGQLLSFANNGAFVVKVNSVSKDIKVD